MPFLISNSTAFELWYFQHLSIWSHHWKCWRWEIDTAVLISLALSNSATYARSMQAFCDVCHQHTFRVGWLVCKEALIMAHCVHMHYIKSKIFWSCIWVIMTLWTAQLWDFWPTFCRSSHPLPGLPKVMLVVGQYASRRLCVWCVLTIQKSLS